MDKDIHKKSYKFNKTAFRSFLKKIYGQEITTFKIKEMLLSYQLSEDKTKAFLKDAEKWSFDFLQEFWEQLLCNLQSQFSTREIRVFCLIEGLEDGVCYHPNFIAVSKVGISVNDIESIHNKITGYLQDENGIFLLRVTLLKYALDAQGESNDFDEIMKLLSSNDFQRAENLYTQRFPDSLSVFGALKKPYLDSYERNLFQEKIDQLLSIHEFLQADLLYRQYVPYPLGKYEQLKADAITEYFLHMSKKVELSKEQALAIGIERKNFLVKARAGSGKTRILSCKTAYLINRYNIDPDHILLLAFNQKAAKEITSRVKKELGQESYNRARTFHGLAYQIVQPHEKIDLLFNNKGEFSRQVLSEFVQEIVRDRWQKIPGLSESIYEFFRKEWREMELTGTLLNNSDYIAYLRSLRDVSLGGDHVRSRGEKIIADYLFEHDIFYFYERVEFGLYFNYRPDFYIIHESQNFVIEFWGIDENDPNRTVPLDWTTTWAQYHDQMEKKRAHWQKKRHYSHRT